MNRMKNLSSTLVLSALSATLFAAVPMIGNAQEGGRHHRGMEMRDGGDPARAAQHIERMIERRVPDATADQKARLAAIAKAAMADVKPLKARSQAARAESTRLLTQPMIDRAALERVRADQVGIHDAISRRMSQAWADAAEVLTPAQRAKIAERMAERRAHMRKRPS